MKRIVWIAVAILIMICILGYGLHTLNKIDEVNKKRREKQAGEALASQIIMTTATESIWDKLRATTEASTTTTESDGNVPEEAPTDEVSPVVPDVSETSASVQTNTVTNNGAIVIID